MRNPNITLPEPSGLKNEADFPIECKDCPHIRSRFGKRECWYITSPKLRKFPCFFRVNVAPGGFDGKYGATVQNYVKKGGPPPSKDKTIWAGSVEPESKPTMQIISQENEIIGELTNATSN
jgi:hypothetical protein